MKSLFLTLIALFCAPVLASPVFGTFALVSVETEQKELGRNLESFFASLSASNDFKSVLTEEEREKLGRVRRRGTNEDYQKVLKEFLKDKTPDLTFKVAAKKLDSDLTQLTFTIQNGHGKDLFFRESKYSYDNFYEYEQRLEKWLEEFKSILPPVGRIVGTEEGLLEIEIVHRPRREAFLNRPFHLGRFDYTKDLNYSNVEKMGVVTEEKGQIVYGYLFSKFKSQRFSIGDYITFLKKTDAPIKNKEKISKSKTYFNYLNLPQYSLLDCTLLPVIGNLKTNKALYQQLSQAVLSNKLCKYRENKELEKLLDKYEGNLESYLQNESVLGHLAKILRVGSLFKLAVHKVMNGFSLSFEVVSENGVDIYYSKYTVIEEYDADYISELVLGWIVDYKKNLPLTGRIIQIRGEDILIDIPANLVEGTKQEFKVIRPQALLYEEIQGHRSVEWETKDIAYGSISHIKKNYSIGTIFKFKNKKDQIREGDWIFMEDLDYQIKKDTYLIKKHNLKTDRDIGALKLSTEVTNVSASSSSETIVGAGLGLDLYLPKGFLIFGEAVRYLSGGDQSISNNNFKYALGYSFTPRIYDYFALIDLFVGHRTVNYNLEGLDERGIGNLKYSGLYAGVRTEIPIYKKLSLVPQFYYNPSDTVKNSNDLFGEVESSNGYEVLLSAKYKLKENHRLYIEYHNKFYSSEYDGVDKVQLDIKSNLIKLGYGVTF